MAETVYLCLIAYLGGLIQGMTGFGVMLVALPLMALMMDIKTAIPLILMLGLVMNVILVCRLARHVQTRKWLPLLMASLPGVPVGVYILKTVEPQWLELLVGGVIIGTAAATWQHGSSNAFCPFWPGSSRVSGSSIPSTSAFTSAPSTSCFSPWGR